jgi:two-component system alkaline phosphatase synthesis response regulator PhoP
MFQLMTKIVVIEDDKDVIDVIRHFLTRENYTVLVAQDGLAGIELATRIVPDLILLDLTLPNMDGMQVCKKLKSARPICDVPLIMVTAKTEVSNKVQGLGMGADDYVTKPFNPYELIARVKANLRNQKGKIAEQELHYRTILVDRLKHIVRVEGKEIDLTAKEFELLVFLITNQGRLLTRSMMLNHVWGSEYFGTTRTLDVHINHLRQKISSLAEAILTIKPLGYKLQEDSRHVIMIDAG